jgi:hypothetical protein
VYFVLDEPVGRVHLTGSVSVRALERVFALDGCAAPVIANIPMYSCWDLRGSQTREEAELSWTDFSSVVSSHVDGSVLWFRDIVVRYWIAVGFYRNFDITINVLGGDYRCTETGIDA